MRNRSKLVIGAIALVGVLTPGVQRARAQGPGGADRGADQAQRPASERFHALIEEARKFATIDRDRAIQAFETAATLGPLDPKDKASLALLLNARGGAHTRARRYAEAIADYKKAEGLIPGPWTGRAYAEGQLAGQKQVEARDHDEVFQEALRCLAEATEHCKAELARKSGFCDEDLVKAQSCKATADSRYPGYGRAGELMNAFLKQRYLALVAVETREPVPLGYLRQRLESAGDTVRTVVEQPGGSPIGRIVFHDRGPDRGARGMEAEVRGRTLDLAHEIIGSGVLYEDDVFLKFYERKGDLVRVLDRAQGGRAAWIRLSSPEHPLQAVTWIEAIVESGGGFRLVGYDRALLRRAPAADAPVVLRIDAERHVLSGFTGRIQGAWAEAVVVEVRGPPDDCYGPEDLAKAETGRKWTGWIKVIVGEGPKTAVTNNCGGC